MTREQTKEAKYLYCIIKCGEEYRFNGVSAIGGGDGEIHTVVFADLACVVSDSPDMKYDSTRANMMIHETVIERVMTEFTVLPVRFGTVTRKNGGAPAEAIRRLLKSRIPEFQRLYDEMDNRVELGLKALWRNEAAIYQEIAATHDEVSKLRDAIRRKPPQATHFDRIRLGEIVKKTLDQKREKEGKMLLARLRAVTERIRENPTITDRMVLNAALLVNKDREMECDEIVQRLDEEMGQRIMFKYTGPNPPFNFCQISVNWEET